MRALLDLIVPAVCAGCGRAGPAACAACCLALAAPATLRWPSPTPPGLPPPFGVAAYDGPVRRLVVAYKDRDAVALRRPLGAALATAIAAAASAAGGRRAPVLVVPVASSRPARRRRGYEPVLDLARSAVAAAGASRQWRVLQLLEHVRAVHDSAGLTAAQRAVNLHGALRARAPAGGLAGARVVLVDDVITTGATLAEAARALRMAGIDVAAAAVVAATPRRR